MRIKSVLAVITLAVLAVITPVPSTVTAPPIQPHYNWTPITFHPPTTPIKPANPPVVIYEITAYTAGPESTGKRRGSRNYGITASGRHVKTGVTVACPASMPFGTVLDIDGVGRRTCWDRGGAIHGKRIDVYIPKITDARKFGRQRLPVKITKPGSDVYE